MVYDYLKKGHGSVREWRYVSDPRGIDYYQYANETLKVGEKSQCSGAGDCDDFAILMSALIESMGGTTRVILAYNNTTGHAYAEVYLGKLDENNISIQLTVEWLKQNYRTEKIYTHIDPETKEVWLNLDWGGG